VNSGGKILLVEDDPAVAMSLSEGLAQEGFTVDRVSNGTDALSRLAGTRPQLIILDVRLPDGSGFDYCRRMREMKVRQPIIMLTARREETDKVIGLEMGADDYVTKPYSLAELVSRIRAHLRRAYGDLSSAEANTLYAGDLVIDRGRAQVWRGERLIPLTPTEFRLLVYMAQNAGQVLSRGQMLDAVWGYDSDVESERAINVHIRRLREKVEVDASNPTLLLTVPGVGYRMAD
jgi:DNA-binding response OmpR family regulator